MSENNLTRDEAAVRARLLTVTSYDVELDLTDGSGEKPGDTTFRSRTVVRFTSTEPGATTYIDLTAPALVSASRNVQMVLASGTASPSPRPKKRIQVSRSRR